MGKRTFLGGLVTGALLTAVIMNSPSLTMLPVDKMDTTPAVPSSVTSTQAITPTPDNLVQSADVMPDHTDLGVSFDDTVVNMVQGGAIDKAKFTQLYAGRQPLSVEQKELLDVPSSQTIIINQENAGLLLNLLWPLGIANKSTVLSEGPIGTQYKGDLGGFASTGGWTLGKLDGGKLVNSLSLVRLTTAQEAMVMEIAQHIYRPCCDNPTAMPDCNHGAAMLGFIELAVSQGMNAGEVYRKALILNSYWFPQNYMEIATYLKAKQGQPWQEVDARQVLGATYSSGRGFGAVDAELKADGLLPKVNGGGGCGA